MAAITNRYARAFADALFDKKLDALKVSAQLHELVTLLDLNPSLKEVWENPSVPAEQKRAVLDAIAPQMGIDRLLRNLVAVVIDHGRVGQLREIAKQLDHEVNERLGLEEAEVTTARELGPEERSRLEAKIAGLTARKVKAHYSTDAKILGGAVIRMGSTVFDGSVRGQLERLKEELIAD